MIIVPLAGPDFVREDGSVKAEQPFKDSTLLQYCLESRPWAHLGGTGGGGYVFVMYDCAATRRFAAEYLAQHYPESKKVWLSAYTKGAAFSAAAGIALADPNEPLIVDLADIYYRSEEGDPYRRFDGPDGCDAIALTFPSDKPQYSYLREENGRVVEAREKVVISNHASAGTYIFKDARRYYEALAWYLANPDYCHNGLYFVCPLYNGVPAHGGVVERSEVELLEDIKVL